MVDATAGLGQDAFVLASLGCRVTLFERNPVIHALLADGLARAAMNVDCAAIVERMRLLEGSSIEWLAQSEIEAADVVYLDPMFPHRDKSALVKKEMQVFRTIVGDDEDSGQLLASALEHARYRVVVKRPRKRRRLKGRSRPPAWKAKVAAMTCIRFGRCRPGERRQAPIMVTCCIACRFSTLSTRRASSATSSSPSP